MTAMPHDTMSPSRAPPPLLFIVGDSQNPSKSWAKRSHVSSRYKVWNKANHRDLALDSTTRAILNDRCSPRNSSSPQTRASKLTEISAVDRTDECADAEPTTLARKTDTSNSTYPDDNVVVVVKPWEPALRDYEDWVASPLSILGSQFFDIFTPSASVRYDVEIKSNVYFYFKTIMPFASHLLHSWTWFNNLAQIQASPCLIYAIATYASVFLSGMLRGGRGVVLPPPTEKCKTSSWQMPPWLRLHTKCLAELNIILADPAQVVDESCYQTVLFLYRLSVLLADGESGRMHLRALQRMSALLNLDQAALDAELAVSKINIIGAFLHSRSIVLVRKPSDESGGRFKEVVEIDRRYWRSDREWYSHRAGLAGRTLTWRPESPSSSLLPESAAAIARMDPNSSHFLSAREHREIQRCYQIGLFFWMYLNCINFNTASLIVRSNLLELQYRLSNMDLPTMSRACHTTLFNILLGGMTAARCKPERQWFTQQIVSLYPNIQRLDTIWQLVAEFYDPLSINFRFIEEVWEDIVAVTMATAASPPPQGKELVTPIKHFRPTSYSPDLTKPLPVFEVQDLEEITLEKSLHKAPKLVPDIS
ncbi:hypothetical protein EDD36DRAFT_247635 [Exophiala viscosa]|uniref:Transcription factor domain-containing protein n=1 Tax=Exophiala viscosa TaxID=2486360 RepID=A0AAN6IDB3_9EURO|nr:hypothetical protein EDD36DRAFT_247635 [Exophiala viscosa]